MANLSKVLYNNALTSGGTTVAYSGTETDGFNKENLTDYKDFSLFQPESNANTSLDFVMGSDRSINKWGFFIKKTGNSGTFTMTLSYESSPSTFTTLDTITGSDGKLEMQGFSSVTVLAGRTLRIAFNLGAGPFYIRQMIVGTVIDMERGQYAGVNPQTLTQGIIQSNNISENGAILGTNVKRVDVKSQIDLQYCTESWVRSTWEAFALHASKGRGFFYQWNPTDYPEETVYCVASKINPPKNTTPTPLMSVSMPIICRQPDL
jgi:hypothetical protein